MIATTTPAVAAAGPQPGDFAATVDLLSTLGAAERELRLLTARIEQGYVALVDAHRVEYARLQAKVAEAEAALETLARRNPQWFEKKKTVGTPYGAVKFVTSTELVAADEDISVQLIMSLGGKAGIEKYLRTVQVLNREALAELSDTELARFGLVRKQKQNFSADTEVVDLGKAVKAIEKTEATAAKAAKKAKPRATDNLDAQLRQIDQPQQRAAAAIRRIQSLMYHLGVKVGNESIYVRGISRNLFGSDQYQDLNDIELAQLEGVLVRRLYQLHSRDRVDEFLNEAATYATEMDRIATGGNKDDPF